MALTPQVRSTQAGVMAATLADGQIRTTQVRVFASINFPAEQIRTTQVGVMAPVKYSTQLRTTQARVMAVVRGVVDNPKLISWYFTLDNHEFWVLKLGTDDKTLIYDLTTGQWSWWCSRERDSWRAHVGMNWYSAGTIPNDYGSNVIVGDDTLGMLWVLDPEQATDDDYYDDTDHTFPRVATGQLIATDRNYQQMFSAELRGSIGYPSAASATVTLSYSDDQGNTFVDADEPIVITSGNYAQELDWRSLGVFRAPGRLMRISDDGALQRIDSLEVNE